MSVWVEKKSYNRGKVVALECTFDTVADLKKVLENYSVPDNAMIIAECTCERDADDSVRHIEIKWKQEDLFDTP